MHAMYKKMIARMKEKAKRRRKKRCSEPWFLYILSCADGSLYTGITNHLGRRLAKHQAGKASKYTRTRRPVTLRYQEPCRDRVQALVRECQVKAYPKKKKESLILNAAPVPA